MTKKTFFTLFTLGVLLSTYFATQVTASNGEVVLTESNHVAFSGPVNDQSVAEAQVKLGQLSKKLSKSDTIYLVIDSPGGSIAAGNLFIDFARSVPQKIKPICLFCASMGYHMFQSFDERIVYPSSTLMSHRASLGGLSGQIPGELDSRLAWIKSEIDEMDEHVAKRIGVPVAKYKKLIHDELWLTGTAAVKQRHADTVAKIRCDNDLVTQTDEHKLELPFFGITVKFKTSKCPLITGIIDLEIIQNKLPAGKTKEDVKKEIQRSNRTIKMEF